MAISQGRSVDGAFERRDGAAAEVDDPAAGRRAVVLDVHAAPMSGVGAEDAHDEAARLAEHRRDLGAVDAQRRPARGRGRRRCAPATRARSSGTRNASAAP